MKKMPEGYYLTKEALDNFNIKFKIVMGIIIFILVTFFVYAASIPMTEKEVKSEVDKCQSSKGTPVYVFKEQGKKESGVLSVSCHYQESDKKETQSSIFDDDDTAVTATGQPSMSGLSGGPF